MIYSNFSKPTLDIILFSRKLSELVGWQGPIAIFLWYFVSGYILKLTSPAFGKLTAIEQRL
jgi:ATP-binding cassette subfamily D (ALD) protein 3